MMRFYLFSLFIISTAFASGEEVLAEKTDIRSASTNARMTDKRYSHRETLVDNPSTIVAWKEFVRLIGAQFKTFSTDAPKDVNEIIGRRDIDYFGMGDFRFAERDRQNQQNLYTFGLRDCIAFIAYDHTTGRSCLFHVSKMHLRPNHEGNQSFATDFLPRFFEFFGTRETPEITLVGSCYSNDLRILLGILGQNRLRVKYYNFPDVAIDEGKTYDDEGFIASGYSKIIIDRTSISTTAIPDTDVLLDVSNGSISISRRYFDIRQF